MGIKKTPLENELEKYFYAMQNIKRLTIELDRARMEYQDKYDGLMHGFDFASEKVKGRKNTSPVEQAAILLADIFSSKVEMIAEQIQREKRTIQRIQDMTDCADLTGMERNFIRLRYFEMFKETKIMSKLFCSRSMLYRARKSALDKLEAVFKGFYRAEHETA